MKFLTTLLSLILFLTGAHVHFVVEGPVRTTINPVKARFLLTPALKLLPMPVVLKTVGQPWRKIATIGIQFSEKILTAISSKHHFKIWSVL
ncbi:MAG: hypothetical protein ACOCTO_00145 [Marinilabiliaceae bacterium]